MDLHSNMQFEIKENFLPNFSNSNTLRIIEVTPGSVIVQMQNSNRRGVFPRDNFQYWIKRNSLVYIDDCEEEEKTS